MPSPDVARYIGLELIDVTAQQLLDTALANLALSFPDWTPREGNTELVLLEELAAMVEDDVYAINALVDALAEVLLRMFGLTRDQGAPPSADVRFVVVPDAVGYTIPAGTTVRLPLGDAVDPVDLVTSADLVIAPGSVDSRITSGIVNATGTEPTLEANGKPAGTVLELLDALTYVETVKLASAASGGRLPEDGVAFLNRGIPLLTRLTTTLVRPVDVEAYVVETADVARVKVLDLFNPLGNHGGPPSPPGLSPGYVTVAVAGAGGSSVGVGVLAELAATIRTRMHAGIIVNVVDADVATVDVSIRVLRFPAADATATEAAVEAAVRAYLDPDTWAWDNLVRINELIARADSAAGVDAVLDVTIDGASLDYTVAGYAPLVRAGTITVVAVAEDDET